MKSIFPAKFSHWFVSVFGCKSEAILWLLLPVIFLPWKMKKKNLLTWEIIISYLKILDECCCNTSASKLLIKFFSYKRALNIKLRYTLKFMTSSFVCFFFTLRKPILTQLLFPHLFSTFLNTHHRLVSVKATHCLTSRGENVIHRKILWYQMGKSYKWKFWYR